ncbi:tRNA (adenosine(37)-N6)-threonylcarbamoyltransferase complex ATPase subunit type 1 TsaE [bacterium]|nr:tRNA (adenosine(37)-N6)-threonylcarbamoyltransferase complex ATPase subunit type 1 TsaE [bacterium]
MIQRLSHSPDQTEEYGRELAHHLGPGDTILLYGDLGTGKTVFTRGIVKGLCSDRDIYVSSPSYVIVLEYRCPLPVYHIDLFRLEQPDLFEIGLEDYFTENAIVIVEWAEKMPFLPSEYWRVDLVWQDEFTRSIAWRKLTNDPDHGTERQDLAGSRNTNNPFQSI